METTFENAKVGDVAWSAMHGPGIIVGIQRTETAPILFQSVYNQKIYRYTLDGKMIDGKHYPQCLFWSDPHIVAPPKPKEKKKIIIRLVKWRHNNNESDTLFTKDIQADSNGLLSYDFRNLNGKGPMLMTLEWEE